MSLPSITLTLPPTAALPGSSSGRKHRPTPVNTSCALPHSHSQSPISPSLSSTSPIFSPSPTFSPTFSSSSFSTVTPPNTPSSPSGYNTPRSPTFGNLIGRFAKLMGGAANNAVNNATTAAAGIGVRTGGGSPTAAAATREYKYPVLGDRGGSASGSVSRARGGGQSSFGDRGGASMGGQERVAAGGGDGSGDTRMGDGRTTEATPDILITAETGDGIPSWGLEYEPLPASEVDADVEEEDEKRHIRGGEGGGSTKTGRGDDGLDGMIAGEGGRGGKYHVLGEGNDGDDSDYY